MSRYLHNEAHAMIDACQRMLAEQERYIPAAGLNTLRFTVQCGLGYGTSGRVVESSRLIRAVYDCAYYAMLAMELVPCTTWTADDDDLPF